MELLQRRCDLATRQALTKTDFDARDSTAAALQHWTANRRSASRPSSPFHANPRAFQPLRPSNDKASLDARFPGRQGNFRTVLPNRRHRSARAVALTIVLEQTLYVALLSAVAIAMNNESESLCRRPGALGPTHDMPMIGHNRSARPSACPSAGDQRLLLLVVPGARSK